MMSAVKPINQRTDREAMGLTPSVVVSALCNQHQLYQDFRSLSVARLVDIVESLEHDLSERYVAGQLLALLGDPRIDLLAPAQVMLSTGQARIGTDPGSVAEVMQRFAGLGLEESWINKETPSFVADINAFKLMKYLVTNQEYYQFLQESQYPELPTSWSFGVYPEAYANHPVHTVSCEAAEAYATWLSEKTQRAFRLPTEIEWEYAARGEGYREYPWGERFCLDHANTLEQQLYQSTPVGMFAKGATAQGVMDMAGNVEEYVACDYAPYPGGMTVADDLLQTQKSYRVARGGSFTRHHDLARCARRHGRYNKAIYVMGFRLAESC